MAEGLDVPENRIKYLEAQVQSLQLELEIARLENEIAALKSKRPMVEKTPWTPTVQPVPIDPECTQSSTAKRANPYWVIYTCDATGKSKISQV